MGYHPDVDAAMEQAIATLTAAGATVVDVQMPTYNRWNEPEFEVLLYEFKDGLNAYLAASASPHKSLEALIAWNTAQPATRRCRSSGRSSSSRRRPRGR